MEALRCSAISSSTTWRPRHQLRGSFYFNSASWPHMTTSSITPARLHPPRRFSPEQPHPPRQLRKASPTSTPPTPIGSAGHVQAEEPSRAPPRTKTTIAAVSTPKYSGAAADKFIFTKLIGIYKQKTRVE